jgi:hypothetical protein
MAVAKKTTPSTRKNIVRIDVQPSVEAAEASKRLMVEGQGYKAGDITIHSTKRLKLVAEGVSVSGVNALTSATFEDPSDGELFVVIGTK